MRTSTVRTQSLSPQSSGTTQIARFTYPARRNWGTVAFLLNYVPILGPLIGVTILVFAGLLSIPILWLAFAPAGVYLVIHVVEGETITPMLLARRFTINPVLIILALCSGIGCGGFLGQSWPYPCWRLPKSSVTASKLSQHSAISSRDDGPAPAVAAAIGRAAAGAVVGAGRAIGVDAAAVKFAYRDDRFDQGGSCVRLV
jgi:hypothetical protein